MHEMLATSETDRRAEKRLVTRARRGEADALRQLVDTHRDRLFSFVHRIIRNHHDAEEVVQDAFLKAFASLESFSTEYRFSTWLFTIAYRLCLNSIRRKRVFTGEFNAATLQDKSEDSEPSRNMAESDESRHLCGVVWKAVERLTDAQKATVVLFYRHEHSCQEIAQILELPVATVKSHLHRARSRLKELLQSVVTQETSGFRILAGLAG